MRRVFFGLSLLFRVGHSLACTGSVPQCMKCDTATGLFVTDSLQNGLSCNDGDSSTVQDRCLEGLCSGVTYEEAVSSACTVVRQLALDIEFNRRKPGAGWEFMEQDVQDAWKSLGYTSTLWANGYTPQAVWSPYRMLTQFQQSSVSILYPPRCGSLCNNWSSLEKIEDSMEQWDLRIAICFNCSTHDECFSGTGFERNAYCARIDPDLFRFANDTTSVTFYAFSNVSLSACTPSLSSESEIPLCFRRRDFAISTGHCPSNGFIPESLDLAINSSCPVRFCANSCSEINWEGAFQNLRNRKVDTSLISAENTTELLFPGLAGTLATAYYKICRHRTSEEECTSAAGQCAWNFSVCIPNIGVAFAGASTSQSGGNYVTSEKKTGDFTDIPVKVHWEEFLISIFFCQQFDTQSKCERNFSGVAGGKQECYWEANYQNLPLLLIENQGAIPRYPGPCRPCCSPVYVSSFDSYDLERGAHVLAYWWMKNCDSIQRSELCSGSSLAQKTYCLWDDVSKVCRLDGEKLVSSSILASFVRLKKELEFFPIICYFFKTVADPNGEGCVSDWFVASETIDVSVCETLNQLVAPKRPIPYFCDNWINQMFSFSASTGVTWTAAKSSWSPLGFTEAIWQEGGYPNSLVSKYFHHLDVVVQQAMWRNGWSSIQWDLHDYCAKCVSSENCVDKFPAQMYCHHLSVNEGDGEYDWESGLCFPCLVENPKSFACFENEDFETASLGCGDPDVSSCSKNFLKSNSFSLPSSSSCNIKNFACPSFQCTTSFSSGHYGSCVTNITGVILDVLNYPQSTMCDWGKAGHEIGTATRFCSRYSGLMEDCEADVHCLWDERSLICGPNYAIVFSVEENVSNEVDFQQKIDFFIFSEFCESFNFMNLVPVGFSSVNEIFYPINSLLQGELLNLEDLEKSRDEVLSFRENRCVNSTRFFPNSEITRSTPVCSWDHFNFACHVSSEISSYVPPKCNENPQLCMSVSVDEGDGISRSSLVLNMSMIFPGSYPVYSEIKNLIFKSFQVCTYFGSLFTGNEKSCKIGLLDVHPLTGQVLAPTCKRIEIDQSNSWRRRQGKLAGISFITSVVIILIVW